MEQELSALPAAFPAGTTVKYRRKCSDYPASAGWTLKLHLAGAKVAEIEAVADGDDYLIDIDAGLFNGSPDSSCKWVERVYNQAGEVYQIAQGIVMITADLAQALDGAEQEWLERAILALRKRIERKIPDGFRSYQIAGRAFSFDGEAEAYKLLKSWESELFRLRNPDLPFCRPVLTRFTPTGFVE